MPLFAASFRGDTIEMRAHGEIPVEAGNKGIKDGSLPETINAVFGDIQPEALTCMNQDDLQAGLGEFAG